MHENQGCLVPLTCAQTVAVPWQPKTGTAHDGKDSKQQDKQLTDQGYYRHASPRMPKDAEEKTALAGQAYPGKPPPGKTAATAPSQ